ncbi:MAG: CAP domain-containing protein [Candidatus Caenarcaniphilales bacterium]|nr:CAP domain-containing protein [Candidatus Caenarcaniphilales bacterium]
MAFLKLKKHKLPSLLMSLILLLSIGFSFFSPLLTIAEESIPEISKLEHKFFGYSFPSDDIDKRLSRLEVRVLGYEHKNDDSSARIERLRKVLNIPKARVSESFRQELKKIQTGLDSSNGNSTEINKGTKRVELLTNLEELSNLMVKIINQERSFRSLQPLQVDEISQRAALEHASYLVQTKQFSHYGLNGSNPDQRYTKAGGEGRLEEIVDGFFASVDEKGKVIPIEPSNEIPNQLMDAILKVPDKSDILFNNDANDIGLSFVIEPAGKQLVVVINIVSNHASLASVPSKINGSEMVNVSGSLSDGFKFAWVGVSKKDFEKEERSEVEPSPYFAPIDQVIYTDKTADRAKNIAQKGGLILAMVAAPFTYGTSMLVASVLMQSISQTYQAQDVEVRSGVKASGSSFNGNIGMGEWGPGLYYITIWGYPYKEKKPTIVSRRAIIVT